MFAERFLQPELLDHAEPEEARRNLADLVRINRMFGGHAVIRRALARVVRNDQTFSLLDIGAASGDSARVIRKLYPAASVTNVDSNRVNLGAAPMPKLVANAFQLPFRPDSFDYVLCSLFLHHFDDGQVIELLRSFYGLARRALVICDLERHVLPYLFLAASKPLFRWGRITVHDGLISVRASFRPRELLDLAAAAGVRNASIRSYRPAFRLSMVAMK
jgi:SAM-dependent methyltransferase